MTSSRRTKPTRLSRPVTNGLQGGALLITIGAASATPTRAKHVSQPQTRIQTHRRITHETATLADVVPNDNRHPAGRLHDGVLTVALEAKDSA